MGYVLIQSSITETAYFCQNLGSEDSLLIPVKNR